MKQVRTRFAPSPTGPLHIGGLRTAIYNYLFARRHKGQFIVRIEDTDQVRLDPEAENYIQSALEWLNIRPSKDCSPWSGLNPEHFKQSNNLYYYKLGVETLIHSGHAYWAFDSPEDLYEKRKDGNFIYNHSTRDKLDNSFTNIGQSLEDKIKNSLNKVIRLKVDHTKVLYFTDLIRGEVRFDCSLLDDKILWKSDGFPTYHLANVVDDHSMEISHVIRGEEWLSSTPIHILLYEALGWELPEFAHLPLMLKPKELGKGKLSKRDWQSLDIPILPLQYGAGTEVAPGLHEAGFLSEAVVNYLVMSGWNEEVNNDRELYSLNELSHLFSLDRVHKAGSRFDPDKLTWFQKQHVQMKSSHEWALWLRAMLAVPRNDDYYIELVDALKSRCTFPGDFIKLGRPIVWRPKDYDVVMMSTLMKDGSANLEFISIVLKVIVHWKVDSIKAVVDEWIQGAGISKGKIYPHLRLAMTGSHDGIDLFDTIYLVGQKESIDRIELLMELVSPNRVV